MRAKPDSAAPQARSLTSAGIDGRVDAVPHERFRHGALLALGATVLAAFTIYAALVLVVGAPRVFSDELLYFDTAASIAEGDGFTIRGEAYRYAPVYPALLAPVHWVAPDRDVAYQVAKALNALLLALTAIPVFLLARRVIPPWPSTAAAVLSVAIPSAMYTSVVMTECLAYLVCWCSLYAIVLALERPTVARQLAAMLGILLATGVRTQFFVLAGVYLLGLVLVPWLVRTDRSAIRSTLLALWPTVAALSIAVIAVAATWILGSSDRTVGEYSVLFRTYDIPDVAKWSLYQLANIELYVAVVPLAVAPIVLVAFFSRARQGSERHAAFLALFVCANAALLILTAAFNTTIYAGNRLHDRPAFYIVPLWFIVLFAWVADGTPRRPLPAVWVGAALALTLPILLPFEEYARDDAPQQFNAVVTALWASVNVAVGGFGLGVLMLSTLVLVLATLLLPGRGARLLPFVVAAVLVLTSALNWDLAVRGARSSTAALHSEDRFWLDDRVPNGRSAMLLESTELCRNKWARKMELLHEFLSAYQTEFFNSSMKRAAYLNHRRDSLPAPRVTVAPGGLLILPSGAPLVADYVVAQRGVRFAGRRVPVQPAARLALWEIGGNVRALGIGSVADYKAAACSRSA